VSYIGAEPTTAAFPFDQFSGNGTTTAFTLTYAPASTTSIIVAISGVVQNPNLYSVIGTTITFSPAPPTGTNNISVLYLGLPVQIGTPIPGSRLELALGSAANPSLTFLGDTNTGIFSPAADTIAFSEGGTEVARFDSSGNLGIGTSSTSFKLDVAGNARVGNVYGTGLTITVAGNSITYPADNTLAFNTNNTERARIDSSGNLLVGTTTAPNATFICRFNSRGVQVENNQDTTKWRQMVFANNSADAVLYFPNGTNTPSLSAAGAWTNASDGRQKTNVTDIKYGLQTVLETQPHSYNRTDVDGEFIGFVAQELKEVIPEVVLGSEETSYGVDYGSLVAVAFKAIQELKAELDATKAEVALLKGAA
jgi:hypothetical protein